MDIKRRYVGTKKETRERPAERRENKKEHRWKKKLRRNETNEVEETNAMEEIAFTITEETDSSEAQKASYQHDWLADSATTSHITNQRSAFTTFQPLTNISVRGVGDVTTKAKGCGTVELESECNGVTYLLKLEDVLYIPTNRNNLISLGRWDNAGGCHMGGKGTLTLIAKNRKHVAIGRRINNHLYKMNFTMQNASELKGTTPVWVGLSIGYCSVKGGKRDQ